MRDHSKFAFAVDLRNALCDGWNRLIQPVGHLHAAQIHGAFEGFGFLVRIGANDEDRRREIGLLFVPGRKALAIRLRHVLPVLRVDEMREREADAQLRGEEAAEVAGAEHPEFGARVDLRLQQHAFGEGIVGNVAGE